MRRLTLAMFSLLLTVSFISSALAVETPDKPRAIDSRVAGIVTVLIKDHMSQHALDDEISERAMKQFIDGFDEMKRFFTQQDIDEFMEFAPIAFLEAVAVPHNFPTGKIYIRETTTRKVGSLDFRAADPMAGKYLTGRPKAVENAIAEMNSAIKWH